MRLLDTETLTFKEFVADCPKYAILSHTWHDDEVLYQDFKDGTQEQKRGYEKVKEFCNLALSEGLRYAWVDTCCIDKSSSAELQESINSMYKWYEGAATCYVYLDDVEMDGLYLTDAQLQSARWMTRGWTLQELIAPEHVLFFSRDWEFCGTRRSLARQLGAATGIDLAVLSRTRYIPLHRFSIAQRMSWCSKRVTTRPEDIAYCLLGVFDVQLPLLYGEGAVQAFYRLQEAIMQQSTDYSIFAWSGPFQLLSRRRCLATSPSEFSHGGDIICFAESDASPFEMTNAGVRLHVPVVQSRYSTRVVAVLHNCRPRNDLETVFGIGLEMSSSLRGTYTRWGGDLVVVGDDEWKDDERTGILIERESDLRLVEELTDHNCSFIFDMKFSTATPEFIRKGLSIRAPPIGDWEAKTKTLRLYTLDDQVQKKFFCTLCYTIDSVERPLFKIGFSMPGFDKFALNLGWQSYGIFSMSASPTFSFENPPSRAVRFHLDDCEMKLLFILSPKIELIKDELVLRVKLYFRLMHRRRRLMRARLVHPSPSE